MRIYLPLLLLFSLLAYGCACVHGKKKSEAEPPTPQTQAAPAAAAVVTPTTASNPQDKTVTQAPPAPIAQLTAGTEAKSKHDFDSLVRRGELIDSLDAKDPAVAKGMLAVIRARRPDDLEHGNVWNAVNALMEAKAPQCAEAADLLVDLLDSGNDNARLHTLGLIAAAGGTKYLQRVEALAAAPDTSTMIRDRSNGVAEHLKREAGLTPKPPPRPTTKDGILEKLIELAMHEDDSYAESAFEEFEEFEHPRLIEELKAIRSRLPKHRLATLEALIKKLEAR